MTKTIFTFLVLFCIFSYKYSYSQSSGTGLGIIVGEPAVMSFNHWVSTRNAIDAGLAWSFTGLRYFFK